MGWSFFEETAENLPFKWSANPGANLGNLKASVGSGKNFGKYVTAEGNVVRTPQTLAEVEDAVRLNAGLADDATKAAGVPRTQGRFGTRAHSRFEALNNQLNQDLQQTGSGFQVVVEQCRDVGGNVVGRRAAGSLGSDVVIYQNGAPVGGFDLKTGRPWDATKLAAVQSRFGVPIKQIGTR